MVEGVRTEQRDQLENGVVPLSKLINWTLNAEEASQTARGNAERDRDYYDNKQLTTEEVEELRKRGQPPIVINRIKRKIDFLDGLEKQQRTDPKAYPRNPGMDEESAEAATDSIRFVIENNNFDVIRSDVWQNMLIEGFGGAEVGVERKRNGVEIFIKFWAWDRLGFDPHSTKPDFSDARYVYTLTWMDLDEAKAKWPHAADVLDATMNSEASSHGETYDDKPRFWTDSSRKRVRIVQMYYRFADEWRWTIFSKGGVIRGGDVPYQDDEGSSFNPMTLASAYVDRENNRYGVVREMIDPQDEINKRRSKTLHQFTQRQTIGEEGAVLDIRKAKQELAKPDGHVEVTPGKRFEIAPNVDHSTGQMALLQEAKNEIDLMGPNASMTGKSEKGAESGRAIIAQQQGGFIEIATLLDRLRQWNKQIYRKVWYLIKQYWTEARWVRVTENPENIRFVGLNQPMTVLEQLQGELTAMGIPPGEISQEIAALQNDPRGQTVAGIRNNVAEMDVDIILEDAPDMVTIQQEQFDQLVGLAQAGITFPPEVDIQASQLRNKDHLIEILRGGGDQPDESANLARGIAIERAVAETDKIKAETAKSAAEANKKQAETLVMAREQGAI